MRIIQLPEAEEGAPSFADSQGYIWRLVETVDTPEAAEHLAKTYHIDNPCPERACMWYAEKSGGIRETCFELPCRHRNMQPPTPDSQKVLVDGRWYLADQSWTAGLVPRAVNPWGHPENGKATPRRHIPLAEWRQLLETLGYDTDIYNGIPEAVAEEHRLAKVLLSYWQFAQDRRITEEGLRYPIRLDAYRYYLDMENLNRKELLEAGVPARLLDEGYASFGEGEIQQMRRAPACPARSCSKRCAAGPKDGWKPTGQSQRRPLGSQTPPKCVSCWTGDKAQQRKSTYLPVGALAICTKLLPPAQNSCHLSRTLAV